MFKIEMTNSSDEVRRSAAPWWWGAGLGAGYGAAAGAAYGMSFGLAVFAWPWWTGGGGDLVEMISFATLVGLIATVVATVVGVGLGSVGGLLVALAAPSTPRHLGTRAVGALLCLVALLALVWTVLPSGAFEAAGTGVLVYVVGPALFAVPALLLHARAVTRRVHGAGR